MTLHLTLTGMFDSLFDEAAILSTNDAHLASLFHEFKDAIRDLRIDRSQGRVKSCIQKEFNFLEAVGQRCPGVTENTLGKMCGQIKSWPHIAIREALSKLYGFRCDYPGLGHAGNPKGVLRDLDIRDLVALGVMLAGFMPYLTDNIDPLAVYGR